MRESGFYWVRDGDVWHLCCYFKDFDKWLACGNDEFFTDSDFDEIDERKIERLAIDENRIDPEPKPIGETSDGYHTFNELYEFRKVYNAALFNEWAWGYNYAKGIMHVNYDVHKSWRHNDGELCFGGGWFIVVAILPTGQISNHYEAKDWDLFKVPEFEKAKYPFDGHTSQDVLKRLKDL